jgi:hypothetical protein
VNRTEFQQLAEVRIEEAAVLLAAGKWDGAYYMAGYAVECGLKACIAKRTVAESFPPDRKFVEGCYSHNLPQLRGLADLNDLFDTDAPHGSLLRRNWDAVKEWSEATRYTRVPEPKARQLLQAISDPVDGVLPWIKKYW